MADNTGTPRQRAAANRRAARSAQREEQQQDSTNDALNPTNMLKFYTWMFLWLRAFRLYANCGSLNISKKTRSTHVKQHFSIQNYENRIWELRDLSDTQILMATVDSRLDQLRYW